jgi:transcriptional/translational regulatory protein YebC/TACO1
MVRADLARIHRESGSGVGQKVKSRGLLDQSQKFTKDIRGPAMNPRLRLAIEKAKAANMPADRIKYNVDKASGNLEGQALEEIRYEGYGIGGAAVIVDTMTDNRVRTVAEVRHAFSKYGGNLGTDGSVSFQFKHCGQLIFAPGTSEDLR